MMPIEFENRLGQALIEATHPPRGATLLVAVSGGPDSVALLTAVDAFNRRRRAGWSSQVAHFNHRLRGAAADADERFVARLAERLGLKLTIGRAPRASKRRAASEESARQLRLAFLLRVAKRVRASAVLLAHHADDQAETVLHHVLRGSGLRGLAGMDATRPLAPGADAVLVRPMLDVSRADVTAYLAARGETFCRDATNDQLDRTRNRIRHGLLPLLEAEFNPQVRAALCRLGRQARWASELLQDAARNALPDVLRRRSKSAWLLDAAELSKRPMLVRTQLLVTALQALGAGLQEVRFEHLCRAAALADPGRGGRIVELPAGVTATRVGDAVRIARTRRRRTPARNKGRARGPT